MFAIPVMNSAKQNHQEYHQKASVRLSQDLHKTLNNPIIKHIVKKKQHQTIIDPSFKKQMSETIIQPHKVMYLRGARVRTQPLQRRGSASPVE